MNTAWNLLTGTLTKYALLAVNLAVGVFLMPFTVRHLGTSEYGLWMLVASMTYYFQLLDLGYGNGLVRQVADADARNDVEEVNRVLSTFVVVYGAIGVAAAGGIVAIILWVLPRFPNLTPDQVARAQIVLAFMGVRIAIGFPMTVFGAATTARQRFALNNTVAIVVALVNAIVTYVVLSRGHGLVPLVASTTIVSVASYGAYAWTAHQAFPQLRIRFAWFTRRLVREVTLFSMYLFIMDLGLQITFNLDNVVIGAVIGTAAVAIYAVTVRLSEYQRQFCNQLNTLLFPVVVRFGAGGQIDALRNMLIEGTRIAFTLVVGVTICLLGFAQPLITRWMGPGFEGSVLPLYFLAIAGIVLVSQEPIGNVLLGTGRHRLVAVTIVGASVVNLALSILLVKRFGMWGVAAGTMVPVIVANAFVMIPAGCRQVGLPVAEYLRHVARPAAIGALPAIATCVAFRWMLPPESLAAVVGEGFVVGVVYLVAVALRGLDSRVRTRYMEQGRQLLALVRMNRTAAQPVP